MPFLDQVFKSTICNLIFNLTKLTTNLISRSIVTLTITISLTSSTSSYLSLESLNSISKLTKSIKSTFKSTIVSLSNWLIRVYKPSAKQASQNQYTIKKEEKKRAQFTKKLKTTNTMQLDKFELSFCSS